jgi:hypothetical protein
MNYCAFGPGEQVLLYGNVPVKLIKRVLKEVGTSGKVLVIGRNNHLTRYRKLIHSKYRERVVINPFFENLPEDSLHAILVSHASISSDKGLPLASQASAKLKSKGRLLIIASKTSVKVVIELSMQQTDFTLVNNSGLLSFQKVN